MILCRYGTKVQSVDPNFDSKAMSEVGFRRNEDFSVATEAFFEQYRKVSEHSLSAEAEGNVHDEVESVMLDRLLEQLLALVGSLDEGQVLFIESEKGKDYPRTRTRQSNVVVEGENRLHFNSSIDPTLRVAVYESS